MRISLLLACAWLLASRSSAQVTVEIATDQDQFLPGESMVVGVRITNFSGQTLHFGKTTNWVSFVVKGEDGYDVNRRGEVPISGEFDVESSSRGTRRVDLAPYFNLTQLGRYRISAVVRVEAWDKAIVSSPKTIDIIRATKIWDQVFGVPSSAGPGEPPEARRFTLQQAVTVKHARLYVRLTDASEAQIYQTFALGPLVSFGSPQAMLDALNNLHVLWQTDARKFGYAVVDAGGHLVLRQTHMYSNTRPDLRGNKDGKVDVVGGLRVVTALDLPPQDPPETPSETPSSPPPADGKSPKS